MLRGGGGRAVCGLEPRGAGALWLAALQEPPHHHEWECQLRALATKSALSLPFAVEPLQQTTPVVLKKEPLRSQAGIAALRPLFMFFKPHCYMFEVWFMIEKLLLTGVVRLISVYFGGFFLANGMALIINNFMLCLIVGEITRSVRLSRFATLKHSRSLSSVFCFTVDGVDDLSMVDGVAGTRPSKTDPYNTANIISHISTLATLVSTIVLKFP